MITAIPDIALPTPPVGLVQRMLSLMENPDIPLTETINVRGTAFDIKSGDAEWKEWITTNITSSFIKCGIQSVSKNFNPHKDRCRTYGLIYIIKAGGYNVKTNFHKRIDSSIPLQSDYRWSEVTTHQSFKFNEGSWNLINNQIIHSVSGITGTRISLTIDFMTQGVPSFLAGYTSTEFDPSHLIEMAAYK